MYPRKRPELVRHKNGRITPRYDNLQRLKRDLKNDEKEESRISQEFICNKQQQIGKGARVTYLTINRRLIRDYPPAAKILVLGDTLKKKVTGQR